MKNPGLMIRRLSRQRARRQSLGWSQWFVLSAGGVLGVGGLNGVLDLFGKSQVWDLQDPLFGVPFRYVLFVVGVLELFLAWLCLFTNRRALTMRLVAWLAVSFIVYRIGLWTMGWSHPWVFVGGLSDTLNISPVLADAILFQVTLYLLAGSIILLLWPHKQAVTTTQTTVHFKAHCKECGGRTAFDAQWIGLTISCPHCGKPLQLNKSYLSGPAQ